MALYYGLVLVVLFATTAQSQNDKYCDDREWFRFRDNCYSFESKNQRLSYYDAEDYCRSKGAHLVSIHSQDESFFVFELIDSRYGGRRWIGLNTLEGKHKWSDDSFVDYLNIFNKTQYKKENCFIMNSKASFRPEHCELRYYPICKRPADVAPTPIPPITPTVREGNCPQDWFQFEQKCFKFFGEDESTKKKFKDAKLACMALGEDHDLASIHTRKQQAFLTEKMGLFGSSAWIGFSQVESDEVGQILVFGWTDNSRVDFTFWRDGHPLRGTWKNCARLHYEGVGKGEWLSDYCDIEKRGYICERPPDVKLPPQRPETSRCVDGSEYNGSCYKLHTTPKSWVDAEATCRTTGGHLVSITDGFEQAFLHRKSTDDVKLAWTGLRTVNDSRIFRWSNSQPMYYTNFDTLPYPSPSPQVCVYINASDDLRWKTANCEIQLPFVCEVSNSTQPSPVDVIGDCPTSESSLIDIGDNYCYHINETKDDRLQWGQLARYCLRRGMEMITLTNDHQSKSLMAYLWQKPYDYWLGLIRSLDRQSLMWVDNSSVNYTNWKEREPDMRGDKECAGFSATNSKWSLLGCNEWVGTICRVKKTGIRKPKV